MQIVVKSLKLVDESKASWYRSIEGRLVKDEIFSPDLDENCALNYYYENGEGYIYLFSINDKSPEKIREHKIYIKFYESEKVVAQEIVQKYLIHRIRFWESVNEAFYDENLNKEDCGDESDFSFDFNKILNSDIKLPEYHINKEYSLPIIIPINEVKTLELLAAGIYGFNNISIITTDQIAGVKDFHSTVFITNIPDRLKSELTSALKEETKKKHDEKKDEKKILSITSRVIAATLSTVGILVIAFAFFKNNFKGKNKK